MQKTHTYPCSSCGADLLYEPTDGYLTCPYCGYKEQIIESSDSIIERPFSEYLQVQPEQMGKLAANALEVKCQSCGATITFTPPEVAGRCEFCGVQIVAQPKEADPIVAPEGVLPFSHTASEANVGLRQWLSSRWFAPNALKHFAQPDAIHGIYLPFWTYDANTSSRYTGQRGDYYYVTETYYETDSNGNQVARTREVRQIRWSNSSGIVELSFDDILVNGTRSLPEHRLADLEPWDLQNLKAYEPAYLAGFRAQRYQVDLAEGFERAKELALPTIESAIRTDIGGNEQRITGVDTHYSNITFKHILLPVYAGAYRFNGKIYQIVVNGRTGEIQGDRPYSIWKIAALVLFLGFLLMIVLLIASAGR
jgi:DNA-directed RNA polymerase subunit RPC12/RpoP